MKVVIEPGKYILAVSGGVDSMVLLDILAKQKNAELVVAHFNHGIRHDADEDEKLVSELAQRYGLPLETGRAQLGRSASEAEARKARYDFLNSVKDKYGADGIITAHHRDDLIETALINILRGTGPRGMAAPVLNIGISRPLSNYSKEEIYEYAKVHGLRWREDYTNEDEEYLRNYLRKRVLAKLSDSQKKEILNNIDKIAENLKIQNKIIEGMAAEIIEERTLSRRHFSLLPVEVGAELLTYWFRQEGFRDFDRPLISRAGVIIRTGTVGSRHNLDKKFDLILTKTGAKLTTKD